MVLTRCIPQPLTLLKQVTTMSIVTDYQHTLDRRRADRAYLADAHAQRRRDFQAERTAARIRAERLDELYEMSGLVFMMPNPYGDD